MSCRSPHFGRGAPRALLAAMLGPTLLGLLFGGCNRPEKAGSAPRVENTAAGKRAESAPAERAEKGSSDGAEPNPGLLADTFQGTAGETEVKKGDIEPVMLKDVRSARHEHYDRVVFEFDKAVPGYRLEYIDRPVRQCGSGDATEIAGDGWLEIRFYPAYAHTEQGRPTIAFRERKLQLGVLREVERTCDFEAEVTWVLGTASPNRYRAQEFTDPPRLVVDVRH